LYKSHQGNTSVEMCSDKFVLKHGPSKTLLELFAYFLSFF